MKRLRTLEYLPQITSDFKIFYEKIKSGNKIENGIIYVHIYPIF